MAIITHCVNMNISTALMKIINLPVITIHLDTVTITMSSSKPNNFVQKYGTSLKDRVSELEECQLFNNSLNF